MGNQFNIEAFFEGLAVFADRITENMYKHKVNEAKYHNSESAKRYVKHYEENILPKKEEFHKRLEERHNKEKY